MNPTDVTEEQLQSILSQGLLEGIPVPGGYRYKPTGFTGDALSCVQEHFRHEHQTFTIGSETQDPLADTDDERMDDKPRSDAKRKMHDAEEDEEVSFNFLEPE